jgi:hypothetical protein
VIIRQIFDALRKQEWGTALVELLIVVIGIYLGLQASNWQEDRKEQAEGYFYLDLLRRQLSDEIRTTTEAAAFMSEKTSQVKHAATLLYAESWTDKEFQQFKDQHWAAYVPFGDLRRPSALRQLVDNGKIDLVRSRQLQEKLFAIDVAFSGAIQQSKITEHFVTEAVNVISMKIPYGTRQNLNAFPATPEELLGNDEVRAAFRVISIMNGFQLESSEMLQQSMVEMRDELHAYLSTNSYSGVEPDRPD